MRHVKELEVDIGGKNFLISSDDEYLEQIKNGFEPDMVALFKLFASGSQVTIDIGANIGCTALLFGELSGSVHAFEPSVSTYAFLEKNVARASKGNIQAHNLGLGSEATTSTITFSPANRSGGFVSDQIKANADYNFETIEIQTLDHVASAFNIKDIDFIKIDVEGFEGHVLQGGKETLEQNRPVVVLELNHWCLNAFQRTSVPDFFDLLKSIFPIVYAVDRSYYLDLNNEQESFSVMYQHIVNGRFNNIVAGFDHKQFEQFRTQYEHGFFVEETSNSILQKVQSALKGITQK